MNSKQQFVAFGGILVLLLAVWIEFRTPLKKMLNIGSSTSDSLESLLAETLGAYALYKGTEGIAGSINPSTGGSNNTQTGGGGEGKDGEGEGGESGGEGSGGGGGIGGDIEGALKDGEVAA